MTGPQYTGDEVRQLFATATENVPPGLDLLAGFQARQAGPGRRHRPGTRVLLAGGAMAAAAGSAIAVTLTAGPVPSAMAQLTRAAAATAKQSYEITSHVTAAGQPGAQPPVTINGAFDPVRNVGLETIDGGPSITYANGYVYLRLPESYRALYLRVHHTPLPPGKDWVRFAQPLVPVSGPLGLVFALQGSTGQSVQELNPQGLLTMLQSATRVHQAGPASGPGWTGTRYSFSVDGTMGQGTSDTVTFRTSGTVDVDQQGRVRHLTATETIHNSRPPHGVAATTVKSIDVDFNGFGQPVQVALPPTSQVFTPDPSRRLLGGPGTR